MLIKIDIPGTNSTVEFTIHKNGTATVRLDGDHLGKADWEKDGDTISLTGLPRKTFGVDGDVLTFELK